MWLRAKYRIAILALYTVIELLYRTSSSFDPELFLDTWFFIIPVTLVGGSLADYIVFHIFQQSNKSFISLPGIVGIVDLIVVRSAPKIIQTLREHLLFAGVNILHLHEGIGDYLVVSGALAFGMMLIFRFVPIPRMK